jgi:hypothetical protein
MLPPPPVRLAEARRVLVAAVRWLDRLTLDCFNPPRLPPRST